MLRLLDILSISNKTLWLYLLMSLPKLVDSSESAFKASSISAASSAKISFDTSILSFAFKSSITSSATL
ncbi:MAG: hypothetical protein LBC61_02775 [Candidatus Peribacteria bacterium]|jgi:type III secretory pathway component EscS|nr:hypothetical protein [Candidatus Peribacteria bacterium]